MQLIRYILPFCLILSSSFFLSSPAIGASNKNTLTENTVVTSNTAFALDLYAQLKQQKSGNLFFSPYSLSVALAMTSAGARNKTAKQMTQVLHFTTEQFHSDLAQLQQQIQEPQKNIKIQIANALWAEKSHPFLQTFRDLVVNNYSATLKQVDFKNAYQTVHLNINTWVGEQTHEKITHLIAPGDIDRLTRLILTNAIYFKGYWQNPFNSTQTNNAAFWLTSGQQIEVPMMNQKNQFAYTETNLLQVLELPYATASSGHEHFDLNYQPNNLSLIILLPRQRDGLAQLENNLTLENLNRWLKFAQRPKVTVFLPKFKINTGFELSKTLALMGMRDAFSARADFSGIMGSKNLGLKSVIHQAFVDVNEEGTEAAASSAVIASTRGLSHPTTQFVADHPFIFLIRHQPSGSILFLGRVINPIEKSI